MDPVIAFFDELPLGLLVLASLTLGLAPFVPEPHIWEKIKMLRAGTLKRPLDWFDFALHLAPFVLLLGKLIVMALTA